MKTKIVLLICLMASFGMTYASSKVSGTVVDKFTKEALGGVNIKLHNSNTGTSSSQNGYFELILKAGNYQLEFSHLGYETHYLPLNIKEGRTINITIQMIPESHMMDEMVVTASKTPEYKSEIPGRIEVLSRKEISSNAAKSADELLTQISGVNVDRSSGIFGKSVVSIRGIVGGEQGRILVLQDGIPINKTDGGSVNWNRINVHNIEKIEVFKGPGSSIYGSNAMGGVINIFTKKSSKKGIHGFVNAEHGTFNTWSQNMMVGGKLKDGPKGLYWNISANNRTSDGYIDVPEEFRDETIIKTTLKEKGLVFKIGYDFNFNNTLEFEYNFYDDERGQGQKIRTEQIRENDTHLFKAKWNGSAGISKWSLNTFYQNENFKGIREKEKKGNYTRWDIDSKREELGALFNLVAEFKHHRLSVGADFKSGKVNGADIYQTSTDIVRNIGSMDNIAFFIQNKYSITKQLKFTAGLRFDIVNFHDGEFRIDGMTGETNFMEDFTGALDNHNWNSLTPKIAIHYKINQNINTYVAWSKGFRAPTLDDLCRSGFISGGFKIANPNLGPETVNSIEWGLNLNINNKLKILPGVFYMKGKNFMYYLGTGDFIFGGRKPVLHKNNITEVSIFGADIDLKYQLNKQLSFYTNYTYTNSEINQFDEQPELEGKSLTYTPDHMANAGITFENKIVNISANFHYQDKRYRDDENEKILEDYATLDVKLWKEFSLSKSNINQKLNLYLDINNLMDKTYMVRSDQISMGRFINFGASFNF